MRKTSHVLMPASCCYISCLLKQFIAQEGYKKKMNIIYFSEKHKLPYILLRQGGCYIILLSNTSYCMIFLSRQDIKTYDTMH